MSVIIPSRLPRPSTATLPQVYVTALQYYNDMLSSGKLWPPAVIILLHAVPQKYLFCIEDTNLMSNICEFINHLHPLAF